MASTKLVIAKILKICQEKWPDEFKNKYNGSRENFRDWLNEKTGLQVDHIVHKDDALIDWLNALEAL